MGHQRFTDPWGENLVHRAEGLKEFHLETVVAVDSSDVFRPGDAQALLLGIDDDTGQFKHKDGGSRALGGGRG